MHTDVLRGSSRLTAGLPPSTIAIETSHRPAQNEDDLAPQLNVETASAAPPLVRSPGSSVVLSESENVVAGGESEEPVTFATPPSDHCGCSRNEDENSNEEDGVHADRYGGKKVERKIFGPKPNIAWDCVRTRPAKKFPGLEKLEADWRFSRYDSKVELFIKRHTSLRVVPPTTSEWIGKENLQIKLPFLGSFNPPWFGDIRPPYLWKPISTSIKLPPPKGLYVVVGIFNDSGALLQEVIVYTGGQSLSKQLVLERRDLFGLPILRDVKAFGLYECDPVSRTHTKVDLRPEERDCLASLFEHVEKIERYFTLRLLASSVMLIVELGLFGGYLGNLGNDGDIVFMALVSLIIPSGTLVLLKLRKREAEKLAMRSLKEEIEWRDWIQNNLNEGHDDPSKARYSLLCVIGWSKLRIVLFVGSHKGDVQGAWGISSFIITLAAALAGLLGLVGGLFYR